MNPFRRPTIPQLLATDLDTAQRELIKAEHWAEYYAAHVELLRNRVRRLQSAIEDLPETTGVETSPYILPKGSNHA